MLQLFVERLATPAGDLLLITDEGQRVHALDWADCASRTRVLLDARYGRAGWHLTPRPSPSVAHAAVAAFVAGDAAALDAVPVAARGTAFQREVWGVLRRLPVGATVSYGEIARRIGRPAAVRAVGRANGANPIALIVPCHRVVGADGSLTGYAGGLRRKQWLLEHEARMSGRAAASR